MKKLVAAFTLLELLLAITFSSFILYTIGRAIVHASALLSRGVDKIAVQRQAALLFHQLEKDLSCALMPVLHEPVPEEKEKKEEKPKVEAKIEKKLKKLEELFFYAQVQEADLKRIGKKKRELLKQMNFVSANPISRAGGMPQRLVRVAYVLSVNKEKSTGDKRCYQLTRKESPDPRNSKFESLKERRAKTGIPSVVEYVISDTIKELTVKLVKFPEAKKDEGKEKDRGKEKEQKKMSSFSWGERKETQDVLPNHAVVHLILWDTTLTNEYDFETKILFLAQGKPGKDVAISGGDEARSAPKGSQKATQGTSAESGAENTTDKGGK